MTKALRERYNAEVSVRGLAAFSSPGGDISTAGRARRLEREGMLAHQHIQASRPADYRSEYTINHIHTTDDIQLLIRGRMDGLLETGDTTVIEEIKSTGISLAEITPHSQHLAQAKIYAAIYVMQMHCDVILVHLTYVHLQSREVRIFDYSFTADDLNAFFSTLVDEYLRRLRQTLLRLKNRNGTLTAASFPFPKVREGQEKLMESAAQAVENGHKLFVRAPTGIGKTAATLFPALKGMALGQCDVIFYLSARTSTQQNAEYFVETLRDRGAAVRATTISARSKVCFLGLAMCKPEICPFAKGYYERLPAVLQKLDSESTMNCTRETISRLARENTLCPHELSLDISAESDIVICDYNYVFDPMVYLRRFFLDGDASGYMLLVDEGHNLVDRGRDMYTGVIQKRQVLAVMRLIDGKRYPQLRDKLKGLNDYCGALRKEMKVDGLRYTAAEEIDGAFADLVQDLMVALQDYFGGESEAIEVEDKILDLYRSLLQFSVISDLKDEGHAVTVELAASDVIVKLLCIDPSLHLSNISDRCRSTVFFSATLTPFEYFVPLLDRGEDVQQLSLLSPFPPENLNVYIDASVSTKYRDRESSVGRIAEYAELLYGRGNYLFYFPSYVYLEMVYQTLGRRNPAIKVLVQKPGMEDSERQGFLEKFEKDPSEGNIAFAVLGGVFGEGIDLVGSRLIGVVIVGVGLPPVSNERNLIKQFYERRFNHGFSYAYQYPGMNKVLQAAGRVIRDENDTGMVLFIGRRYESRSYKRQLTPEYADYASVQSPKEVIQFLPDQVSDEGGEL
ncbi:MAG: ATP-dependent helicase [Spirochaetales bacterium]|nr:ATP-dependent helicase [Spirochaetales bacterium]MAG13808.1 ATP-dependent helicase [Spirochaetales bacterium]